MKVHVTVAGALLATAAVAQPTLWSPTVGGNGHSYEIRVETATLTWEAARQAAEAAGGYLVTITSQAENDFLETLNLPDGAHIGGYQRPGSVEPDGGWAWITGEPFSFSNWYAVDHEPNDRRTNWGNENRLQIYDNGFWNDLSETNPNVRAFIIEYSRSLTRLPEYQYDGSRGTHAITEVRTGSNSVFSFVFATTNIGAWCLVSWTRTLHEWFPLLDFDANTTGTEVSDTVVAPQTFYRTTYLPSGVSPAEGFDYPFGTGEPVPEQITPERNNLYPSGAIGNPIREATSPTTAWRNAQDVGAYYSDFGGLHPGEDWNNGSQSDSDVGESVRAVANGQVLEIRPAGASGIPSTSGYVMVIRHWLLNGDSVDSLYVHIAPDRYGGNANSAGIIGDESDFTHQVGAPVTKGSVIAVIGDVSAFSPHLHFEMRNKTLDVTGSLWPHSTGDAYYGPEVGTAGNRTPEIIQADVQAAFSLMQADGIIDPSDFIDDHR